MDTMTVTYFAPAAYVLEHTLDLDAIIGRRCVTPTLDGHVIGLHIAAGWYEAVIRTHLAGYRRNVHTVRLDADTTRIALDGTDEMVAITTRFGDVVTAEFEG